MFWQAKNNLNYWVIGVAAFGRKPHSFFLFAAFCRDAATLPLTP
jgi:hypothetical protein